MARIITKGLIGMEDLNAGSGTFTRATSTGGTQTMTLVPLFTGTGVPVLAVGQGCIFLRTDGAPGTTLYLKSSGGSTTSGWVAIA